MLTWLIIGLVVFAVLMVIGASVSPASKEREKIAQMDEALTEAHDALKD